MTTEFYDHLHQELQDIKEQGLYKRERIITSPQAAGIDVLKDRGEGQETVINFCANNYLGLADHPLLIEEAQKGLESYGYGMASVRFICGTQNIHRELEKKLADYLGFEDSLLYAACFDANGGLFEPLLTAEDAIISDALNHASIIDGIRLCKARRYRFQNRNMEDLEARLKEARAEGARHIMIATDGVFSMDGSIAPLGTITELAERYGALVMVDDCHATGFMGPEGRGTAAHCGVEGKIDILTGTLGKALGGAMGGYVCARAGVIDMLRQRSRPYLFSNALAPSLVAASLKALELAQTGDDLRKRLFENSEHFRQGLAKAGFTLLPGEHPIIPVMLGEARLAQTMADALLQDGIYVIGFSYPVVPKGQARIRTQMSAAHTLDQIDKAIKAFSKTGRALGVIN